MTKKEIIEMTENSSCISYYEKEKVLKFLNEMLDDNGNFIKGK